MIPTIPGRDPYSDSYEERQDAQECGADDGQLWLERVGHGKECSVIIEDGMVKE